MFHPSLYTLSPIIGVCLIIWFSGEREGGEPTVNTKFLEMIDIANQSGIVVEFTTNGSLLNQSFINTLLKKKYLKLQ